MVFLSGYMHLKYYIQNLIGIALKENILEWTSY